MRKWVHDHDITTWARAFLNDLGATELTADW
jgi:hypothetical protein